MGWRGHHGKQARGGTVRHPSAQSWLVGLSAALTVAFLCSGCAGTKISGVSVSGNVKNGDVGASVTFMATRAPDSVVMDLAPEPCSRIPAPRTVYFAFDSDELTENDYHAVWEIVGDAVAGGARRVRIEAGCCPIGTDDYNLGLGKRRADAVLDVMRTAGGFEKLAVSVDNYGESHLVTTNPKDYGLNRRCVITLSN